MWFEADPGGLADKTRMDALVKQYGLDPEHPLVLGLSRLVPRKGFDVVIDAVSGMPGVRLVIAGAGRDRARLQVRARRRNANVRVIRHRALARVRNCMTGARL